MSETGENYTTFNSRSLIEVVGDVTDEALKATKIKQLLSVLAGRFFNWAGRKSLFTLHLGIKFKKPQTTRLCSHQKAHILSLNYVQESYFFHGNKKKNQWYS